MASDYYILFRCYCMGDEIALLSWGLERLWCRGELEKSGLPGRRASSSLEIRNGLVERMG